MAKGKKDMLSSFSSVGFYAILSFHYQTPRMSGYLHC